MQHVIQQTFINFPAFKIIDPNFNYANITLSFPLKNTISKNFLTISKIRSKKCFKYHFQNPIPKPSYLKYLLKTQLQHHLWNSFPIYIVSSNYKSPNLKLKKQHLFTSSLFHPFHKTFSLYLSSHLCSLKKQQSILTSFTFHKKPDIFFLYSPVTTICIPSMQ